MENLPRLEPLVDGVWTVDGPLQIAGMPIGHRMTVIRLATGGLWLHSPLPHTPELTALLEPLGPIEHWVVPSRTHDLYVDGWFERCPNAASWGAPKLRKPHPDWAFTGWLGADLDAPWRDEIDLLEIEGAPRVGEWMFLHRPTHTAITADVLFNLGTGAKGWGKLMQKVAGTYGNAGVSRLLRLATKDRERFNASIRRVLEWDFDKLVVGHGAPLTEDPKGKLRAAFGL
ncbi:MAG: DUF4336 domain-containing protein [Planctomycetota bacterium]